MQNKPASSESGGTLAEKACFTWTEKTRGKMVPTATMAMLVSKEKSRMPLAHMKVAKHVRNTMNSVCHVRAKRIPSKKRTRYSIKVDHALFWLPGSAPPIVCWCLIFQIKGGYGTSER